MNTAKPPKSAKAQKSTSGKFCVFAALLRFSGVNKYAFTLVEILVSAVILSIIVGSLYVVFKVSADSWKKSNEKLEVYQKARAILEQISRELQSAILKNDASIYLLGRDLNPDEITFVCPIQTTGGDEFELCQVRYYLNSSEKRLMRYLDRNVSGSGASGSLAEEISDLQFKYWDAATTSWNIALDTWDSRTNSRLPKAVKIEITVQEQDKKFTTIIYLPNS